VELTLQSRWHIVTAKKKESKVERKDQSPRIALSTRDSWEVQPPRKSVVEAAF
jgi:hypothetical protein